MKIALAMAIALVALFVFSPMMVSSTQAARMDSSRTWVKIGYGDALYGLPHITDMRADKSFDKLDFSEDIYGLPHITDVRVGKSFDKLDFSEDIYGLPHLTSVH